MLHFVVDTIMHGYNAVKHSTTGANNCTGANDCKALINCTCLGACQQQCLHKKQL